jgi:uncharacterized protein
VLQKPEERAMTEPAGKPAGAIASLNPRDLDLFEFARSGREASGAVRLSQLPRMLNEVPAEAPDRDTTFTWQAAGFTQAELQDDGTEGPQAYLRLAIHGSAWLACQRCLAPYEQAFDADPVFRIVQTEEEADEFPLDDDDVDVIVGSRHFDLVDLIEEELLLSLPLVPKHEVCPEVHDSLASGADGADGVDSVDDVPEQEIEEQERVNPFAALESLKKDGPGSKH